MIFIEAPQSEVVGVWEKLMFLLMRLQKEYLESLRTQKQITRSQNVFYL